MTYYKAIRPNGTDFWSGKVRWAPEDEPAEPGSVVCHPWSMAVGYWADSYLSASAVATDCTGMLWPCRLLEVEPVDAHGQVIEPVSPDPRLPNKRAAVAWRIVRELDPMLTLGPQAEQIVALIERAGRLTEAEIIGLKQEQHAASFDDTYDAWASSGHAAHEESREAAWDAIRAPSAAPNSILARAAIRNAAWALAIRDLIGQYGFTQEYYDAITGPWCRAVGPVHPDDQPLDTGTPA